MNQMHAQLDYQTGLLGQQLQPQQNQMIPDNSLFTYQHQQANQPNALYNLNFNHMDQVQPYENGNNSVYHSELTNSHHTQNEDTDTPELATKGRNTNKASSNQGVKRQKKMKSNSDLDGQSDLVEQSQNQTGGFLYQGSQMSGGNNYYHKQSLVGSSSITSSNSSSTSSSPLSSTSPSHHQTNNHHHHHHHQLTQMGLGANGNLSGHLGVSGQANKPGILFVLIITDK